MSNLNQALLFVGLLYFLLVTFIAIRIGRREDALAAREERVNHPPGSFEVNEPSIPAEVDIEIHTEPTTRTINVSAALNGIPFENYRYAFFLYVNGIKCGVRPYEFEPSAQFEYPANAQEISVTLYMADRNKKITTKEKSIILSEVHSIGSEPVQ